MPTHRLVLSAVALAICQMAHGADIADGANTQVSQPAAYLATPTSASLVSVGGETDGRPIQPDSSPGIAAGAVAGSANSLPATDSGAKSEAPAANEPRIIRGNDKVIAAPKKVEGLKGAPSSFKLEDAPIVDVIHLLMHDILKTDYVLHQPVQGTVTLATKTDVSPDQAVILLESALQANGVQMVRDPRGVYHVGRPEALKGIVAASRQALPGSPLPPGSGAIIVPLQYIGAAEMAAILKPMLPPDALWRVDSVRNLLILAGNRTQAEGWLDIVSTFDVDLLKGMSVGVFPLKYATTREVEAAFRLMSGSGGAAASAGAGGAGSAPGGARAGDAAAASSLPENFPLFGAVRILPIERLNSVLVVTPRAAYLDEARRWIERLDRPSDNGAESQLFVYPVQNGSARHLADMLNGIYGGGEAKQANANSGVAPALGSTSAQTSMGGLQNNSGVGGSNINLLGSAGGVAGYNASSGLGAGVRTATGAAGQRANGGVTSTTLGGVRVVADEVNNALLIYGHRDEFRKIEATLKRLDLSPTQVLIEATIIEVTLDDSLQYGLQWAFSDKQRNGLLGSGNLLNATSAEAGGITGSTNNGFSYTLRNALGGDVRVVLNALASKSLLKVISSPSLMVQDNYTANISVGSQQPVSAGTTISGSSNIISNNIQYKDTGVNLSVTPSVNAGNMVSMVINQVVTDLGNFDQATKQYSFLQRQVTSKVAVRSGESLVLGGLIRDNTTTGRAGIPLLQDIPVVGKLFGSTTVATARTELLVIMTPRVVRSDQEVREVSSEMRDRLKGLGRDDPLWRDVPTANGAAQWLPANPAPTVPLSAP